MSERTFPLLDETRLHKDPIVQFRTWYREAEQAGVVWPNAMTIATVDADGRPSARMVLLKGADAEGFVFYTNYESRKAQALRANPHAALVFWWEAVNRQVRVEGHVETLSSEASDKYFSVRPRGHQLEAHASPQSRPIASRAELEQRFDAVSKRFEGREVPRPTHWGGYRVVAESIEFWQEGANRMHDRILYRREGTAGWTRQRLAP